jgi:hypothetical protein
LGLNERIQIYVHAHIFDVRMRMDYQLKTVFWDVPYVEFWDLGVQSFRHGVGNAMSEVSQYVGQMSCEQLGLVYHGRQTAMSCPEISTIPESLRPTSRLIIPHFKHAR